MITALISAGMGIFGGLVPDLVKEWTAGREHGREIERMKVLAEQQREMLAAQTDAKLAEIQANTAVEEIRAFGKQMEAIYQAQAPTGIRWVDGFNAMIRPTTAMLLMILFVIIATAYAWSLIGAIDLSVPDDWGRLANALWGSMVGEAIQAVLGYLFGYRTTGAAVGAARGNRPVAGLPWLKK